jgi:hypothetical protein
MKKTTNLIIILALIGWLGTTDTLAQKKYVRPTKSGSAGGGVRGLADLPVADIDLAQPEKTRGENCCVELENKTGNFIDIWFDKEYQGRISPWQGSYSLCSGKSYKEFVAQSVGKTLEWTGKYDCTQPLVLESK